MAAQLCVTIEASTTDQLRRRRDGATDADIVELRLDSVSDPDVAGALAGRARPVIVTCRPRWEGGRFRGSEEERRRLLAEALARGAEYVDIEWRAGFADLLAARGTSRIVLSGHDFNCVPPDLEEQVRAMRGEGADIVKLAAETTCLADCVRLLDRGPRLARDGDLVLIGMGEHGLATRVLAERFGSVWTYAGEQAAVGQLAPRRLLEEFGFRRLTTSTAIYGLVGSPVSHSVSPAMHNAAFREVGLDAVYLPCPAVDADDFVTFARALGVMGASVTVPYKVALFDRVDEVCADARRAGAINTIRVVDGRWIGRNTDMNGFLEPLAGRVPLAGAHTAILGAGGAARAVAVALTSSGARVRVHARDPRRAAEVAALVGGDVGPWPAEGDSWDILVNCTPVGMFPHVDETPLPADRLGGRLVYDLVYNPTTTRLLREAAEAGCETIGGLDMLVAQAREQFHWWTGEWPPAGVMREAAVKQLATFASARPREGCNENHLV